MASLAPVAQGADAAPPTINPSTLAGDGSTATPTAAAAADAVEDSLDDLEAELGADPADTGNSTTAGMSQEEIVDGEMVHRRGKYLAIMGKRFPLDLAGGELTVHGQPVFIKEVGNSGQGTGLTVWDGSVVLAKYMEKTYPRQLVGKTVLELGAGTGIVGIVASILGAKKVIMTDLEYVLDNLRACVESNKVALKGEIDIRPLDWTVKPEDFGHLDLIVASDVVWVGELVDPLVNTLVHLTNRPKDHEGKWTPPLVVLCHQTRSTKTDEHFFGLLDAHFKVHEVPYDAHHVEFRSSAINIYQLLRVH